MSVVRAGVLTAVSRVLAQGGQFVVFLIAVRLLTAADFGIFAVVAAWTVILSQFSISGWPEYVMQWNGPKDRLRHVLAVCLGIGLLFALVGVLAGMLVPGTSDTATRLMWALAFWIPIASMGATYAAILNLQERLVWAAGASILGEIANITVSILALLNGQGVLALAYGRLAGGLVWMLSGLAMVRMMPDPRVSLSVMAEILRFAWRIIAVRLLANLRNYAATLVIGFYLGAADAGYFRAAQRLVGALGEVLDEPTRVLSWSLFRSARNAQGGGAVDFEHAATRFYTAQLLIATPLFITLAILADDVVTVILGPDWGPAVPVVRILAIAYLFYVSGGATEAILSLAGRIGLLPYLVAGYAAFGLVITLLAVRWGLAATAAAQVVLAMTVFFTSTVIHYRTARIRWDRIVNQLWSVPLAILAAVAAVSFLQALAPVHEASPLARLFLCTVISLLAYSVTVLLLDRRIARLIQTFWHRR